mgnify:CR=1 FL=1
MSKAKDSRNNAKWIWIGGGIALLAVIILGGWVFFQPDRAPMGVAQASLPAEEVLAALDHFGVLDGRRPARAAPSR